ncbi:hypothetical protein FCM35_KLT09953 [Carex littledalei]|uniref:Uncharacterized protein n=1 Tax=Carex littledalei TaxID=544730 RepID=A0A833RH15_9POAL|nr:hypothetical protein FCM35_KLT09953 [Carex littledalei]
MLRNLVLENCGILNKWENKFYICTPNLEHLRFNKKYTVSSPLDVLNERFYRQLNLDTRSLKLDVPNLKSLILGGYWVARNPAAVTFFLQHSPMLEKLTLICNEVPGYWKDAEPVNLSSDLCFQCKNLKVDIIGGKYDENIPHLIEVFKRNGLVDLNPTEGDLGDLGDLSFGNDCLKMLYDVWHWIHFQMIYT